MNKQAAEETVSTEVAVPEGQGTTGSKDVLAQIATMNGGQMAFYSTIDQSDREGAMKVLAAVTDSEPIGDHLRETILLKDFVMQATTMYDEDKDQEVDILRTILIDAEGKAYHAISDGLFRSLQTYVGLLGHPSTWAEPVAITVDEKRNRKGFKFFTIKLA